MTAESLLEALKGCHAMADKLAECAGFLLVTLEDGDTLAPEGPVAGRSALLAWHRSSSELRALIAEAEAAV